VSSGKLRKLSMVPRVFLSLMVSAHIFFWQYKLQLTPFPLGTYEIVRDEAPALLRGYKMNKIPGRAKVWI
jgi:hypothetical protein